MAMKKPVIANEEIPEQREIIRESGEGILVKFEDKSIANGIIRIWLIKWNINILNF